MSPVLAGATLLLLGAYGAPWLAWTSPHKSPSRMVVVTLAGGIANLSLLSLVLMQLRLINPVVILGGAALSLGSAFWIRSRDTSDEETKDQAHAAPPLPSTRSIDTTEPLRGNEYIWEWALLVGVVVVALWARRQPINFVYQTGDMGEYVNNANQIARGDRLGPSFPHVFSTVLAAIRAVWGYSHTTVFLPALGAILAIAPIAVARQLQASLPVAGLAGLVVAVSPFTVWFGIFPVSESLMAVLFLGAFLALLAGIRSDSPRLAILAALLVGCAAFTRGTGLVLALIPLLTLPFTCYAGPIRSLGGDAPTNESSGRRIAAAFTLTSAAAVALAATYNFWTIHPYMMLQVRLIGGEDFPSIPAWLVAIVGAAYFMAVVALVRRGLRRSTPISWFRWLPVALAVAAVAAHVVVMNNSGLLNALDLFGWPLIIPAAVGLIGLWPTTRWPTIPPVIGIQLVGIGAIGTVLYADRLPEERYHSFWQYWERYTFSEVMPVAIFLMAVGMATAEFAILVGVPRLMRKVPAENESESVPARWVVWIGASALAIVTILWARPQIAEINRYEFFGDSDKVVSEIASEIGDEPAYWSADKLSSAWFFPNTYRAFAAPASAAFGSDFQNLGGIGPFDDDPNPSIQEAARAGNAAGFDSVTVVEAAQAGGTTDLAEECLDTPGCEQVFKREETVTWRKNWPDELDKWTTEPIQFRVYEVQTRP